LLLFRIVFLFGLLLILVLLLILLLLVLLLLILILLILLLLLVLLLFAFLLFLVLVFTFVVLLLLLLFLLFLIFQDLFQDFLVMARILVIRRYGQSLLVGGNGFRVTVQAGQGIAAIIMGLRIVQKGEVGTGTLIIPGAVASGSAPGIVFKEAGSTFKIVSIEGLACLLVAGDPQVA